MLSGDELVANYCAAISAYVEELLGSYVAGLKIQKDGSNRGASKEFNDPIWGTIVLEPHEVTILDSPLLQRLRRIRQLGVAHWVYPGAVHTRLEHSIGVCHQVSRLVASINRHRISAQADDPDAGPLLNIRTSRMLRLTGLCHDIGHGLMSHVIENALRNDDSCEELLLAYKKKLEKDGTPQLSEVAAYSMARTDMFKELVGEAFRLAGLPSDDQLTIQMSNLIVGKSPQNSMPLLHELISGPFDGDKIDYMPRDATMCGVPIVTDIDRLIQKVRAVQLPLERLPKELAQSVTAETPSTIYTVVGLAPSGAGTLDEVALGRSLMFDKIYRHHKVRAAEAMVAAIIDKVGDLIEPDRTILPLKIFDDELLSLGTRQFDTITETDTLRVRIGLDIADRLARRDLFVRAFAFSQHLPEDPYRGRSDHREAIEKMTRETNDPGGRKAFVDRVADITSKIAPLLEPTLNLDDYAGDLAAYIWVDPPASSIPDTKPDTNHAYLIDHDGVARSVAQVNAQTRGWSDAYVNTRDMGYVFTVRELAPAVHIASEVAARLMYGARIHDQARVYSKQQSAQLAELRKRLAEGDFYEAFPPDLRPLPPVLVRGDGGSRLDRVVRNLQGYEPPGTVRRGELGQRPFTSAHVSDWVRQFRPEFADSALEAAEALEVIGRGETNSALNGFLQNATDLRTTAASLVPMGGPKDGSSIVGYYARTAAADHQLELRTLDSALVRAEPIILIDDFLGRGSTVLTFFEGLLGLPDSQNLGQDRPPPLDATMVERLKSRTIALVFSSGLDGAEEAVRTQLLAYGLTDVRTYIYRRQNSLPSVVKSLPATSTTDEFIEECKRIGAQLIGEQDRTPELVAQRSLGYGNHGLLIVFPYNTPTATLTALWKAGTVDGQPWQPLIPRLKKT